MVRRAGTTVLRRALLIALAPIALVVCNPDPRGRCDTNADCREGSACSPVDHLCEAAFPDAGTDAGATDAGARDGGSDGGINDGGSDAGSNDGGSNDAGGDAGSNDAGSDGGNAMPVPAFTPDGGVLAFGLVNCGATAGAKTIVLSNAGTGSFHYSAALGLGASSPYLITGNSDGGTRVTRDFPATITVSPIAIPAEVASLPTSFNDTLTINTTIPGDTAHVISLTEGAQGVILSFNLNSIPFGSIPAGSSQSSGFQLSNSGNVAADLLLSTTTPTIFSADPNSAQSLDAGHALAGNVTFSAPAGSSSSYTDAVTIVLPSDTGLCQPLPTISLGGSAESGSVALSANALNFGNVGCGNSYQMQLSDGGTANSQTFTLTNSGNDAFTYSAELENGGAYTLGCAPNTACGGNIESMGAWSGTLAAGDVATFTITPLAIPQSSAVTPGLYDDTVLIGTNIVGDSAHTIALSESASGAILSFNETELDLGEVPINTSATQPFQVINSGNASANVTVASSNAAFAVPDASTPIAANTSPSYSVTFSPGNNVGAQSSNITLAVDGATILCAPLPSTANATALQTTGTGTNGTVAYSPSALNFNGESAGVNCGSQGSPQTIMFTNIGNQSYNISGSLDAGTAYTFSIDPSSGLVAPDGGTAEITVVPDPIPQTSPVPGDYNDTLTVTTTVVGDTPHLIPLTESAQGVILENLSPTDGQIPFNSVGAGGQSIYQLYIQNAGNVPASLSLVSGNPSIFSFDQPVVGAASGGGSTGINFNAYFDPAAAQGYLATATWGVVNGTVLCQPLPAFAPPGAAQTFNLSGTGTMDSTFTASPTTIDLKNVLCGTAAHAQPIKLSNTSAETVTWNSSFSGSGNALYDLSLSAGGAAISSDSLAANSTTTIYLVPKTIPIASNTSTAPNGYGALLTISGSGASSGLGAIQITIDETAQGAVLSFMPTTLSFTALGCTLSSTDSADVVNSGNLAAAVTLALSGDSGNALSLNTTAGSVAQSGGKLGFKITCSKTLGTAETASVSVMTTSTICAPLPSPLVVTTQ